ncbi:hypothetical protein YUYDRAFT_01823 [Streptomyces sp. ScaeMP-e48]|nr:hypothetical protein YUYDRAFT_01823 [Streptomyces sp. ScaeMP-e48]
MQYIWAGNHATGASALDARAISLREYSLRHDTNRTGSRGRRRGVYDTDNNLTAVSRFSRPRTREGPAGKTVCSPDKQTPPGRRST